jgi:hypothetical protein
LLAWAIPWTSIVAAAPHAHAEPLPAALPAGEARVVVEVVGDETSARVLVGRRQFDALALPAALEDVTLEPGSSAGRALWILRGRGPHAQVAAILDPGLRWRWSWHGRTDFHGDPGERVADAIEVRDFDADGRPDLVVGQRREGVATCGEGPALLFPRALDARGQWRPVRAIVPTSGLTELVASAAPEPPMPLIAALRITAASSQVNVAADASALGPPSGLTDGRADTGWAEGRGGAGVGELIRGQWAGPAITEIVMQGSPEIRLPRRLVLALDAARYLVTLPAEAGESVRVTLPTATRASCISWTLADEADRGDEARIGFTELRALSVADGQGLRALVELLVSDAADGDRAVGWLSAAGDGAIEALVESWERLDARGRRRALRVAGAVSARTGAGDEARALARRMRAAAAIDDDGEVRADAVRALEAGDEADRQALLAIALLDGAPGEEAARALAPRGLPASGWGSIEPLLAQPGPWDRPALRGAVGRTLAREATWRDALAAASPSAAATTALALAVAEGEPPSDARDALVRWLLEAALPLGPEEPFATRFRMARAARVASSAAVDAHLEHTARTADEWMLRAECVEALGARASRELLAALLTDPYPRVRLAAARAVAARPDAAPTLLALARHDGWPLVRAFALEAVVDREDGRALALEALGDSASAMRQRALELLRTRQGPDLVAPVLAILRDAREWPHVTERAVELAEARCAPDLGEGLVDVVARGARASASAADLDNAQRALRAALRIGGETAARARREASGGPSAAAFAPLLERALPTCSPSPISVARRGVPSPP